MQEYNSQCDRIPHLNNTINIINVYYKAEMKFCVSVCKSVSVHAYIQTKRPTASKFGTEILERVFAKISKRFFKKSM